MTPEEREKAIEVLVERYLARLKFKLGDREDEMRSNLKYVYNKLSDEDLINTIVIGKPKTLLDIP